jgi:hypothetical protein
LSELGADEADQDAALVEFPTVLAAYGIAKDTEAKTRHAHEQAREAAYRLRKAWHDEHLRRKEREVVDLVAGPLLTLVREIAAVLEEAGREDIPVTLTPSDFPNVPLRLGGSQQPGLEYVVEQLRVLVARP